MTKLSLLFSLFLSVTVTFAVFILSLVAKVTLVTLIYRTVVVFLLFTFLGILFGSLVDIFISPHGDKLEEERLKEESKLPNPEIDNMLGDILKEPKSESKEYTIPAKPVLSPVSFPKADVDSEIDKSRNLLDKAKI